MRRANQSVLQVKSEGAWRYVFAYVENMPGRIQTTNNRQKALDGEPSTLDFFRRKFADREFRSEKRESLYP